MLYDVLDPETGELIATFDDEESCWEICGFCDGCNLQRAEASGYRLKRVAPAPKEEAP